MNTNDIMDVVEVFKGNFCWNLTTSGDYLKCQKGGDKAGEYVNSDLYNNKVRKKPSRKFTAKSIV